MLRLIQEPHRNSEGVFESNEAFAFNCCHAGLRVCPERRRPNTGRAGRAGRIGCASRRACRPSQNRRHRLSIGRGPNQRRPARLRDLQKKYAPKEAALKSLSDEIDTLTKQLQSQGASLTDAERANRAKSSTTRRSNSTATPRTLKNDFQQDMQDVYNSLASKVYDVMQSYAEQQGYTLILDVSQQQSPVLYASQGTNITKAVIDAYNLKSGVPAPPAAQQAAPASRPLPGRPQGPAASTPKTTQPH